MGSEAVRTRRVDLRPVLGLQIALAGAAVVLSPHAWAEAWALADPSLEFLNFYLVAWAPFALLAVLTGTRRLSPWPALALAAVGAAVTLLVLAVPDGSAFAASHAAAPVLLSVAVLTAWALEAHRRGTAAGGGGALAAASGLGVLLAVLAGRALEADSVAEIETFTVIFASIVVEALPFVLLGALVSGLIEVFVPDRAFDRVSALPLRLQVPGLALAGMTMPVCECGSVPVARRLISRGVAPGAGIAFMLAAPILNPVVLLSTWVAYAGQDPLLMVAARAGLGLVVATVTGLLIARLGAGKLLARRSGGHHHHADAGRLTRVMDHMSADFFFMGRFVVAGAALAAAMQTLVPQEVFTGVLTSPLVGATLLMALAFVLSLCSEADAFVAISFVQFPLGAQLAFLVFGPVLDIKLSLLYAATFGWGMVVKLALITAPLVLAGSMLVQAVAG